MNAVASDIVIAQDNSLDAMREAAQALLGQGNHLRQQSDAGLLELRAGIKTRPVSSESRVILESPGCGLSLILRQERGASPLGDLHWQDYAGEARLLAWSLAHENLVASLSQLFGRTLLPAAFQTDAASDQLWLELCWSDGADGQLQGWLGLGCAAIRLLTESKDWKRDPHRLSTIGAVDAVTLNLVVPGRLLDRATIDALAPGDVLIVGTDADCQGRLQPDREKTGEVFGLPEGWTVRLQQGQWLIAASPAATRATEAARPQFLITSLAVSLEDISQLQPGSVALCDTALIGSMVGIVLHGHRFGEGELVGMGAWLGVRITHREVEHGLR